jgi:hypothetical protein
MNEARRIAANIAKLPVRMDQTKTEPADRFLVPAAGGGGTSSSWAAHFSKSFS